MVRGIADMVFAFVEIILPKAHRLDIFVFEVNISVPNECGDCPFNVVDFRHLFYVSENKACGLAFTVFFVVCHITDLFQHKLGFQCCFNGFKRKYIPFHQTGLHFFFHWSYSATSRFTVLPSFLYTVIRCA